ncbi:MAG TPA: GAF domain-containing protein [Ideonella sp.]|uniref:GAF domain-containing protein n=1 Tax=Ideonella sp. TaxID=1929293 RepID=UPI002E34BD8B|nr:GAF domain-containing protein [Ideonella sp.]HEX5684421.1 GAF domain-containing protein [Ideonella sp.]
MQFLSSIRHPSLNAVRTAWERYVSTGVEPGTDVRRYVTRAWVRSRMAGCDARMAKADVLTPREVDSLLREQDWLLTAGQPFLSALSQAAGADRHAAMLADANGRLLELHGDPETIADQDFPRPGSLLDESRAGANGVGTALAEDGYVELVGPEHFIEGFHAFTCQGVPLHGPAGQTVGVLSMSVRRLQTADRVRNILFCASEAVECELLARWLSDNVSDPQEPLLEHLRQDMIQRIAMARLQLEVAAQSIAAGTDASTMVESALELSRKFARHAAVWRTLALSKDRPHQERIELADLISDLLELLETEARVAAIELRPAQVDRVPVLEDPGAMAWRVLDCLLSAIQCSPPGAQLEVSVVRSGQLGQVVVRGGPHDGIAPPVFMATAPMIH